MICYRKKVKFSTLPIKQIPASKVKILIKYNTINKLAIIWKIC